MNGLLCTLNDAGLIVNQIKYNRFIRVATIDKKNKRNGWYYTDGDYAVFGNWATGFKSHWQDKKSANSLSYKTKAEKESHYREIRAKQEKLQQEMKVQAIKDITSSWHKLTHNPGISPYLARKKVLLQADFKLDINKKLAIPMFNVNGVLTGYQTIDANGNKLFKANSQLKGSFYPIKPDCLTLDKLDLLILCEGYATGSSIYQALNEELDAVNYGVICCFSTNNIDVVADEIMNKFGKKSLFLIADNDEVGLKSRLPKFNVGCVNGQDANDIHCEFGLESLGRIIKHHMKEYLG
ncbi:MAG: hypothetical protein ACK5Z5_06350 [Neisseriaceae bacterium]